MKTVFCLLLITTLIGCADPKPSGPTVYVCNSASVTRYHLNRDCRGLKSCQHKIVEVAESQARDKGLQLCGWED